MTRVNFTEVFNQVEYINERVAALKKKMKSYKQFQLILKNKDGQIEILKSYRSAILKLYLPRKIVRENDFDFKKIETYLNAQWFRRYFGESKN